MIMDAIGSVPATRKTSSGTSKLSYSGVGTCDRKATGGQSQVQYSQTSPPPLSHSDTDRQERQDGAPQFCDPCTVRRSTTRSMRNCGEKVKRPERPTHGSGYSSRNGAERDAEMHRRSIEEFSNQLKKYSKFHVHMIYAFWAKKIPTYFDKNLSVNPFAGPAS